MLFSDVGSSRTDDIGAEAQYYYGLTLYEEENIVDAISALVRVRSVYPGYIEWYTKSLLKLGDCYIKLDDKKNAREMFRAVLKKHKNNEYAKEANQKLKSL
jgi:TolA-binding protein